MEGSGGGGGGGGGATNNNNNNNNNKDLVDTFCEITSSSKEEANFFLESHNWDLDSAVSTFLEEDHHNNPPPPPALLPNNNPNHQPQIDVDSSPSPFPSAAAAAAAAAASSSIPLIPPSNTTTIRSTPDIISMSSRDKKPSKQPPKSTGGRRPGGIRTLSDLNRHSGHDSDSDSDGPQEYYTGGEKSGMIVQDPTKGNDVDSIFDQARQLGAVEGSLDHLRPSSSSTSFTGTGRLLSGETVATPNPQPPEALTHNIVFWSNGFTVDDGPLRRVDDPENAPFLESIRKSECPKELEPADRNSTVHVNLIRREGNRPEPEKQHLPFHGVGRTLGSTSSSNLVVAEPTVAPVAPAPLNIAPTPSMGLVVDDSLPSTSIQLRLADGTRMVARFNTHHTINDIRAFIDASRPGGAISYKLQTVGFPPKQLTDATQTIEQAGLANSVLIQKL